jgi:C1q domain
MKSVLLTITTMLVAFLLSAQIPQGINYQAVVRTNGGGIAANQNATFLVKYIDDNDNSIDYSETFVTVSDAFGLVNFTLGTGVPQAGTFSSLDWSKAYRISVDINTGNGYLPMGEQDFKSVPYALNAAHAESVDLNLGDLLDVNDAAPASGQVLMFDGAEWYPADPGASQFGLPFLSSDPNLTSFGVINTSAFGGTAVTGQANVNHANATGVRGEATQASGRGVYGKAQGANAFGVLGENTQGTAIRGYTPAAGANGVLGIADNATGIGVRGESNTGIGMLGYSGSNIAVSASSLSGTALYGNSTSGYALNTSGNVKIAGGNTNPGLGKVLTSDATGNATWQTLSTTPKIAFCASGLTYPNSYPDGAYTIVPFNGEQYDTGNNYNLSTHVFTTPVNGLYHFTGSATMYYNSFTAVVEDPTLSIEVIRNGVVIEAKKCEGTPLSVDTGSVLNLTVSSDIMLQANDQVILKIFQQNFYDEPATSNTTTNEFNFFQGHLVFTN